MAVLTLPCVSHIWYVAIVTGGSPCARRCTRRSPPRSRRAGDQLTLHCRPATVFVTRISVVAPASAMAAAPTSVLPAPHAARPRRSRRAERLDGLALVVAQLPPSWFSSMACASPSTYPARSSAGQPTFSSACLRRPARTGARARCRRRCGYQHRRDLLLPQNLFRTARSRLISTNPCTGCLASCRRP